MSPPPRACRKLVWQDWTFIRDDSGKGVTGSIKRRSAEDAFLELLDRLAVDGRVFSPHPRTRNYAPRVFAREGRTDFTEAEFRASMERLYHAGRIQTSVARLPNRHAGEIIERAGEPENGGDQ